MRRVIVVGTLACSACSLLTNLDGYSGGSGADAAVPPPPAPTDAGAPSDSGTAATDAGDAACPATFCDDFERASLGGAWDIIGGTPTAPNLDTTFALNGSGSAHVAVPTASADGTVNAFLVKNFANAGTVTIRAWVYLSAIPSREIHLFNIKALGSGANAFVNLVAGQLKLADQLGDGTTYRDTILGTPPTGWKLWVVSVDFAGQQTTASFGGLSGTHPLHNTFTPGSVTVELGAEYTRQGPALDYWIDDVQIDVTP